MGSFILHKNTTRPAIFLVGGIGIAHSSACSYLQRRRSFAIRPFCFTPTAIWRMLRSSMSSGSGACKSEVPLVPILTITDKNYGGWKGETGHLSAGNAAHKRGNPAGPPTMVAGARRTLSEVGVDEDDIRTEEFAGY
jgi:ferredoxin-NADP reductase